MSVKNSDRFIIAYNRIEKSLSKKVDDRALCLSID